MQTLGSRSLPFLAFGRVKDCTVLAVHSRFDSEELRASARDVFQKLLQAGTTKFIGGQRTRLKWHGGSVCCFMDPLGTLLYCLVTSDLAYPERLAHQLLFDLSIIVQQSGPPESFTENTVSEPVQHQMRQLITRYEDPSSFPQLQATIDMVEKGIDSCLEPLAPSEIARQARRTRLRNISVCCTIFLLIIIVIIIIVVIVDKNL